MANPGRVRYGYGSMIPRDHPSRSPYRDPAVAASYAEDRFTTGAGPSMDRREREALGAMLERAGLPRGARVLDCPSGAGRLADLLAARGLDVVAADQSAAMLSHALRAMAAASLPRRAAAADATALPFRDGSFDLVLCHRLLHHLPAEGERRALLLSLAAATRRFVLLSFFDAASLQHLRRVLRRPFRPSGRHALTRAAFSREAAAAGLRPLEVRALRPLVGELTLALLERAR